MRDHSDVENIIDGATGLIQVGWPGGMLTLRYTGIPTVNKEAQDEISAIMQKFSIDCQMMIVWFAGILSSREAMRRHLDGMAQGSEPLSISSLRPDGRVDSIFARIPVEEVIDAFSDAGEFERLYAKAFVIFTYQTWEAVARAKIATALKVEDKHIKSDLMGEWRHLRNWIVHPTDNAEQDCFRGAKTLGSVDICICNRCAGPFHVIPSAGKH